MLSEALDDRRLETGVSACGESSVEAMMTRGSRTLAEAV